MKEIYKKYLETLSEEDRELVRLAVITLDEAAEALEGFPLLASILGQLVSTMGDLGMLNPDENGFESVIKFGYMQQDKFWRGLSPEDQEKMMNEALLTHGGGK